MGLQLQTPIATARGILNDPDAVRYSDADLLGYANDALDQIVTLVPEWFHARGNVACTAGTTEQQLNNGGAGISDALALVRIDRISGGGVVVRTDRASLDLYRPSWLTDTAGAAVNWMPSDVGPLHFSIYPKAPVSQTLEAIYVKQPQEFASGVDTGLPTQLADAISDYVVYRAESRDDEHSNTNRAAAFMTTFVQKVKGG